MVVKRSVSDYLFDSFNYIVLALLLVATAYPCWYVLVASVSNPYEVIKSGGVMLWPIEFQLNTYSLVFQNPNIITGYINTLFYLVTGTGLNLLLTLFAAYALSRKNVPGTTAIMLLLVFTMYFRGGMIPEFLVNKSLGFYDNRLAVIFPYAISTYNLIIMRSFFANIPDSMEESARIDGANDFTILFRIMVPLALPSIAVVGLYYGVDHWNSYMRSLIYLRDRGLFPLAVFLKEILLMNQNEALQSSLDQSFEFAENLKYATIVVATLPILCVYPFIQRFFVKGVMIGAVKG